MSRHESSAPSQHPASNAPSRRPSSIPSGRHPTSNAPLRRNSSNAPAFRKGFEHAIPPMWPTPASGHETVADALAVMLADLGIRQAFGLVGGSIAAICEAVERTSTQVIHCRHETGAALAAVEAHFASDRPTMIFATTGPGIANCVNGLLAARWEGAKVVLVSATTAHGQRGRWAFQESTRFTLPDGLLSAGSVFHYAHELEDGSQLRDVERHLRNGFSRPGGFVAHIMVPSTTQTQHCTAKRLHALSEPHHSVVDPSRLRKLAEVFTGEPFVVWVGFGARHAAAEVRELVERTGAWVMCSPRAKGIFPEEHPRFLGVTGFAGHPSLSSVLREKGTARALVLGTRLGEFTSFWNEELIPEKGIVHVDIDPRVPGAAFPDVPTDAVHSDVGDFLRALLEHIPASRLCPTELAPSRPATPELREAELVRPQALMHAVQKVVIDGSDAPLLVDVGNSFAWATHYLRFNSPGRFRVSMGWGSMGQATAGVVGAALARHGKAVAVVGDGALLMHNEINTAVQYGAKAVFIVLNDSQYGMIEQGMRIQQMKPVQTQMPLVDFVGLARSLGADGCRVDREIDLDAALESAMRAAAPFVVDVRIDRLQESPMMRRIASLIEQGVRGGSSDEGGV